MHRFQDDDGTWYRRRRNGLWREVPPHDVEMIHGKSFCKNTNEWRRAKRDEQLRNREGVETPLRRLGTLVTRHRYPLEEAGYDKRFLPSIEERMYNVSTDLLVEALAHVETRLIRAASAPPNAKTRKREIWLGRWAARISTELARRPPVPFHTTEAA